MKIELEDEEWGEVTASLDHSIFGVDMRQDKDMLKEILEKIARQRGNHERKKA